MFQDHSPTVQYFPSPLIESLIQEREEMAKLIDEINEERKKKVKEDRKISHRDKAEMNEFKLSIYKRSLEDIKERLIALNSQR